MSENAIDSENISKPAPDTKPKGAHKAGKKAKPAKKAGRAKKAAPRSVETGKPPDYFEMVWATRTGVPASFRAGVSALMQVWHTAPAD